MKTRRIICALLAGVVTMLPACGSGDNDENEQTQPTDTSSDVETEPSRENTPDSLPDDLDFNGLNIRIVCRDVEINVQEISAEQTGDIIDDTIYNRNRMVEERLNVTLEAIPTGTDSSQNANAIRSSVMAGSDDYDIVSGSQWTILPQLLEGIYTNLEGNKYIDLSQPW